MKESILGRFSPSVLRVVALSCFMFFISLSSTFAQSYLSNEEAATVVRQEIVTFQNNAVSNNQQMASTQQIGPGMFAETNPQLYANWTLLENMMAYLHEFGANADVRDGSQGVYERTVQVDNSVNDIYFANAYEYLQGLITN